MKRKLVMLVTVLTVVAILVGAVPVMAAKPLNVIPYSNGFPSGLHFNLNIHGKDPAIFTCPAEADSVFIPEYGEAYIKYISDKRSNGYELEVLDPCAMPVSDGNGGTVPGTAEVKIPWRVMTDDGQEITVSGYYVFARILGKPNNGKPKNGEPSPSSMILYPNVVVDAENDAQSTMPLGVITQQHTYVAAPEGFVRFDPEETNTKGKPTGGSKAKDITHLFTWSGWVIWGASPDISGPEGVPDGEVDNYDLDAADLTNVPDIDGVEGICVEEWILYHPDTNGDGAINEDDVTYALELLDILLDDPELSNWIDTNLDTDNNSTVTVEEWIQYQVTLGHAQEFINEWIFNIADCVATEQQIDNDGTKLLQIRFYPIETTTYVKPARIVVGKLTDPSGSTESFEFDASYFSENFFLKDGEGYISDALEPGTYTVEEIAQSGWTLTGVNIFEDNANSPGWDSFQTVEICLDPEETVYVTFINTESQ